MPCCVGNIILVSLLVMSVGEEYRADLIYHQNRRVTVISLWRPINLHFGSTEIEAIRDHINLRNTFEDTLSNHSSNSILFESYISSIILIS